MHRLLLGEGLELSESTVRKLVHDLRLELRDPLERAYLLLEYDGGVDAQVDFFEAEVDDVHRGRVKVHVLLVRACFSGATYAYAAPNQTREALLEGLMRAFEYFGGVFHTMWFDNLTPAVRKVLKGRKREVQRAFAAFAAHYGFKAEFCGPGKGNEKGGVEGVVKYSRSEILTPIPEVDGREGVQTLCDEWMSSEMARTIRGREQAIGEHFELEREHLLALPPTRFEATRWRSTKATPRSWIQVGTNFYSVPVEWVGHEVKVGMEAERVVIVGPGGARAEHRRLYGRAEMSLELDHYLPLLARKHRGLDRAVPVRRFLEREDPCWRTLLEGLRRRSGDIDGGKAFVEVLYLCREHGVEEMTRAVRQSLSYPDLSVGLVRFHLRRTAEEQAPVKRAIEYAGPKVRASSAGDYAVLLSTKEVGRG